MRKLAIIFLLELIILATGGHAISQETTAKFLGRETAQYQKNQQAFGDLNQGWYYEGIRKAREDIMNNIRPLKCRNCSNLTDAAYQQEVARFFREQYDNQRSSQYWEGVAEAYGSRR